MLHLCVHLQLGVHCLGKEQAHHQYNLQQMCFDLHVIRMLQAPDKLYDACKLVLIAAWLSSRTTASSSTNTFAYVGHSCELLTTGTAHSLGI